MIKIVEHEIRGEKNKGINKTSYFCDNNIFYIKVDFDNGFIEENDFSIKLNNNDNEEIGKIIEKFKKNCLTESDKIYDYSDDYSLYHTRFVDYDENRKNSYNNVLYNYHIYDNEKCNEMFEKIINYVKNKHEKEFNGYQEKIQKSLQDKDSRFNIYYVNDDFSVKIEYDSFNEFMYIHFYSRHKHVNGSTDVYVGKEDNEMILKDCKKIAEIIRNNDSKTNEVEYKSTKMNGSTCGIKTKDTNGKMVYVSDNASIEMLIDNILTKTSRFDESLNVLLNEIREFDFETKVKPDEKIREKYPFFFDNSKLNEFGYNIICGLIDQYAPELNSENKDEKAKELTKRFNTQKNNN